MTFIETVSHIVTKLFESVHMKSNITLCTPRSCVLQQCTQHRWVWTSASSGLVCQSESPIEHVDSVVVLCLGTWS